MLIPVPPKLRKPRRDKPKDAPAPAPPPPSFVTVVKVTTTQDGNGRWYFSSPVTNFPGPDDVAGLTIDGPGPVAFIIIGEGGWLELQYPSYVGEGSNYDADDAIGPILLTFENGLPLQLPESGIVGPE